MPTTEATHAEQVSRAERFAEYVRRAAVDAGFDIEGRGGGKKALAQATGMSQSSVGRMLAGQTLPDPAQLEKLAEVLRVPLIELLVRSGVISERAAPGVAPSHARKAQAPRSLTVEEAARMLGIRNPDRVRMFKAMATALIEQERTDVEPAGKDA